jgi:hypothetical protein
MTKSTVGISNPLEATSVANKIETLEFLNFLRFDVLYIYLRYECKQVASIPNYFKSKYI